MFDKEQFISDVTDRVNYCEVGSLCSIPKSDGTTTTLLKDSHTFTVDETISQISDACNCQYQ